MRFRNLPTNRTRRSFISRWNNGDAFSHNPLILPRRNANYQDNYFPRCFHIQLQIYRQ